MAFTCPNDNLSSKFYINGFLVDAKRGVVSDSCNNRDEEVVLEPKVMALLKVLVKNHQQVLSSEELFEQVWPNGIYSPNSVRRNIALLRQAFHDEQKSIVKTHPKRGYSLEADIRFVENIHEENEPTRFQKNEKSRLVFFIALLSLCIISTVVFGYYFQSINEPTKTRLSNIMPITASNGSERYMQVSPDGRFMAFIQSTQDTQERLLLIKDLVTNTEWLLNDESKAYTYLAWENHTNSLIYSHKTAKGIEFVRLYLNKQNKRISESVLFSRNDISWNSVFYVDSKQQLFYLANHNGSEHSRNVSLYTHNLNTGLSETLLEPNDEYKPYKIALSSKQNKLALVGFNDEGVTQVKLLDPSNETFTLVAELDRNWYFLSWFEEENSLLLSNGSQLKQLDLTGELYTLDYRSYNFLVYPQIVADKLYFIEAKSDEDILLTRFDSPKNIRKIIDSNTVDMMPALSPDGTRIAYISLRNGLPQLFIKHIESGEERLVFQNEEQEFALSEPIWDKSAKRLTSSVNNKPFIVELEQNRHSINWLETIIGVPKAWYNHSNAILMVNKSTHNDALIRFDLNQRESTELNVNLAKKRVFLDNNDNLISFGNGKIFNHSNNASLLSNEGLIERLYPQHEGFYYLKRQSQSQSLKLAYYRYQQPEHTGTILNNDIQIFCSEFCDQISEIKGNTILLKDISNSADILRLELKKHNLVDNTNPQ